MDKESKVINQLNATPHNTDGRVNKLVTVFAGILLPRKIGNELYRDRAPAPF